MEYSNKKILKDKLGFSLKPRHVFYTVGFGCVFSMCLIFIVTFIGAFFSPTHSVIVSVDTYGEGLIEMVVVCLASPGMFWCFFITYHKVLPRIKKGEL